MTESVWDIPAAGSLSKPIDRAAVDRLGKGTAFWPTLVSLIAVFGIAVVTMMLVGAAEPTQFPLYAAIGLSVLVPYLLWTRLLFRFDPWTPRRRGLIILAVLWGCLPAVLASVIMEMELNAIVAAIGEAGLDMMFVAPFSEELTKGLFILLVYIFGRRYLRGPWEGVFIGALTGAGFGFAEDIGYLINAFKTNGVTGLAVNYVLREIFTAHAHLVFTGFTGLAAGLASQRGVSTGRGVIWIALGFLCACILHVVWDTSTGLLPQDNTVIVFLSPIVEGIIFAIIAVAGLLALRRREDKILAERLAEYVAAGWLNTDEAASASDPARRKDAAAHMRRSRAPRKVLLRAFYAAQILLALNREKALTAGDPAYTKREDARLCNILASIRAMTAG